MSAGNAADSDPGKAAAGFLDRAVGLLGRINPRIIGYAFVAVVAATFLPRVVRAFPEEIWLFAGLPIYAVILIALVAALLEVRKLNGSSVTSPAQERAVDLTAIPRQEGISANTIESTSPSSKTL